MNLVVDYVARPETLVLAAAACYVVGLVLREQIILRILILIGTFLYIWYYSIAADEPLWEAIFTSILIGISNVIGFINYLINQSPRFISRKEMPVYSIIGCTVPGDFRKLMKLGTHRTVTENERLTTEGVVPEKLYFILSGRVVISKDGHNFEARPECFIGEVSMVLENPASASVIVGTGTKLIEWDRKTLRSKMDRNDSFKVSVEAMISKDMAQKVAIGVAKD